MEKFKHLSYASSLCGACTSVCPVKIDIHNLLLLNRNQSVKEGLTTKAETFGFKLWVRAMKNRTLLNLPGAGLKNFMVSTIFKNSWSKRRDDLHIAPKSFQQLWKERKKK